MRAADFCEKRGKQQVVDYENNPALYDQDILDASLGDTGTTYDENNPDAKLIREATEEYQKQGLSFLMDKEGHGPLNVYLINGGEPYIVHPNHDSGIYEPDNNPYALPLNADILDNKEYEALELLAEYTELQSQVPSLARNERLSELTERLNIKELSKPLSEEREIGETKKETNKDFSISDLSNGNAYQNKQDPAYEDFDEFLESVQIDETERETEEGLSLEEPEIENLGL